MIFSWCYFLLCRRGHNDFDVHFWQIGAVFFSCWKMEKLRSMEEETDGEAFLSRQSLCFSSVGNMIKVHFLICTLNWRVNKKVSLQGKSINTKAQSTNLFIYFSSLRYPNHFGNSVTVSPSLKQFNLIVKEIVTFDSILKTNSVFRTDRAFPSQSRQRWRLGEK